MAIFDKSSAVLSQISNAFSNLKNDISKLTERNKIYDQWVNFLHKKHEDHSTFTSRDLENIRQWIDFFRTSIDVQNDNHTTIKKDIAKLEKLLKDYIYHSHNHVVEMIKLQKMVSLFDKNKLKKEIISDIKGSHITEQASDSSAQLSTSEKWLVNILFNESAPLTYEQIAGKTGKTTNTLRVYMNSLKKKNLVEETSLPSGIKLFNLKSREKVKKLYALVE